MEIIYIDRLFLTNLLADYLLLLCAARLCCLHLKRLRYFLAALLGEYEVPQAVAEADLDAFLARFDLIGALEQ